MYSFTISSVMAPELTARYPRAQKCRPQNFFLRYYTCTAARDHNTAIFSSPKGEGFQPSPEWDIKEDLI